MHTDTPHGQILKADELARLLRCGKSTIYKLAKTGRIPCLGIGDIGVRFDRAAVLAALQQPRTRPHLGREATK
ncbi:hypothetical protein DNFV4_02756 [Nitrospira tepida]|uniref:Helix-turn-helix domain-containing protein n=1 Tax=Nitrospira tepida TaxID=2973512 RepID=A0AA86T605_9BACT|nr:helix-turn-helix domain-containing protein [Nitrospira tepida]CAI4032326.1 hypothetical protein DNFV4_02756 [Nitrospira tepida]